MDEDTEGKDECVAWKDGCKHVNLCEDDKDGYIDGLGVFWLWNIVCAICVNSCTTEDNTLILA
jgi:hypothetical protein